jgi:hypothetical protein
MEPELENLNGDVKKYMIALKETRTKYEEALLQHEVLQKREEILAQIKELETTILDAVEKHFDTPMKKDKLTA